MIKRIKESCSCGAVLEIIEDIPAWDRFADMHIGWKQSAFQASHAKCRSKNPAPGGSDA